MVNPSEFVGLIGPNGSGKSTLLKSVYRILKPDAGLITLDHQEVYRLSAKKTARKMAVVSQESPVVFDFTVKEMVLMGRFPQKHFLESDTAEDMEMMERALSQVGMLEFRDRSFMSLSGGEKQRVMIARALAQQTKILVLDEPTNHLDVHHQIQLMDLVKTLNVTVLAALHDLNLAAYYCDRLYVIDSGKIVASGKPEDILTEDLLRDVFHVSTDIFIHPLTEKVHITYLSDRVLPEKQKRPISK